MMFGSMKPQPYQRRRRRRSLAPPLVFTPTAWAKLLYLRDLGDTEVGGFAISHPTELLSIEDVQLVRQICSPTSVAFDDQSVADFFDSQVDLGRMPEQFARIWVHTHPGNSAQPSSTDEETFARVFGNSTWAVMFILAEGGQTYARLQTNVGPRMACLLPVEIDFRPPFAGSDEAVWKQEYQTNVTSWESVRRDRQAAEIAVADQFLRQREPPERHDFEEVAGRLLGNWPAESCDPFFCGDDPPLDFELQRRLHDGF